MTESKNLIEFTVTRTKENTQLGLTVLMDSFKLGETKILIEKSAYDQLKADAEKLVAALNFYKVAMIYAYEDHVDQYYLNVKNEAEKAISKWHEKYGEK